MANNPRIGSDINEFELTGLVRYGFRRYNTFKNKKPYLLFLLQQPYKTKDGKDRYKGFQILCFNPEYAEKLFALNQQAYVRVKGNVSVETYTKDEAPRTVIKLLANEIEIIEKMMLPVIKPKSEQEKGVPKEIYENTTVFQRTPPPAPKLSKPVSELTEEELEIELGKLK